jgi:hypothetical protein
MGADGNERTSKQASSGKRGNRRLAGWGKRRGRGDTGMFRDVDSLGSIVDSVLGKGDAIILARTSDGGAVCVTILSDDGRAKSYAADQEELNDAFAALAELYSD